MIIFILWRPVYRHNRVFFLNTVLTTLHAVTEFSTQIIKINLVTKYQLQRRWALCQWFSWLKANDCFLIVLRSFTARQFVPTVAGWNWLRQLKMANESGIVALKWNQSCLVIQHANTTRHPKLKKSINLGPYAYTKNNNGMPQQNPPTSNNQCKHTTNNDNCLKLQQHQQQYLLQQQLLLLQLHKLYSALL